jgi:sodium bicarbonate cotransporter 7
MIAIIIASSIDYSVGLSTQKLTIPAKFEPTTPSRGWLISPFGKNSVASIFLAIIPALIATILVFMDQQITAVIINRKEFKMKKSNGYHLDLFIIAISIAVCSLLGLPWFVAATVLALTHVNSLKLMSENTAPGERPLFIGVREQRMTTLIMSVLLGLSVFLTSVLQVNQNTSP